MNQLPPDARELVQRARAQQARSTPEMRMRVRAGIARAVSTAPLAQPAAKLKLSSPSLLKLAAAGATVAAFAGLGLYEAPPAHVQRAPLQQYVAAPPPPVAPPPPALPPSLPTPAPEAPPTQPRRVRDDLGAELRLIERAHLALQGGSASEAMQLLRTHRARFSKGQLSAEREGLLLIASCMLDQPGSRARAANHPRAAVSPLLEERIASACAKEEP